MKYVFILLMLLASRFACAVCMEGSLSFEKEVGTAPLIIVGVVKSVAEIPESPPNENGQEYRVEILHTFKGGARKSVEVFSENSSGRFPMEVEVAYLLFLHGEGDSWQVDNCGNSAAAMEAAALIEVLKAGSK